MSRVAPPPSPTDLGPLSDGWHESRDASGRCFWTNSAAGVKTYYDPRKPNPHPDGFAAIAIQGAPLPEGWEIIGRKLNGRSDVVFLDHATHTSTNLDPRLGISSLPDGWEKGNDANGQTFWANAERRIKTYYDPRTPNPHPGGFATIPVDGNELPEGWEVVGKNVDGRLVTSYLDHKNHRSTPTDPRI